MRCLPVALVLLALSSSGCSSRFDDRTVDRADGRAVAVGRTSQAVIKGAGSPASQDSVVMIQLGQNGFCSGTLIAPNVVLTARHCVSNLAEDECGTIQGDVPLTNIGIVTGANATEQSAPVAHAKKYFYVDGAKDLCGAFDIAVILLDKSITGVPTSKVRAEPVTVGESFVAVGYGEDENKQVAGRRQRTDVKAVAVGPASKTFTPTDGSAAFNYQIPAGEIATSEAVCHGDSGGPIFDTSGRVVGVTSRGADPADVCVARPDIFSAVAAHIDVVDRALTAAGAPTTDRAPSGSSPSSQDPASDDPSADPAGGDVGDVGDVSSSTTTKNKKSSSLGQASSGCAIGYRSSTGNSDLAVVAIVALTLLRSRRRATRPR